MDNQVKGRAPSAPSGYIDLNLSYGAPVILPVNGVPVNGVTGGVQIGVKDGLDIHSYIGMGLMTPGPGAACMVAPWQTISTGWQTGVNVGYIVGGQAGADDKGNPFWEIGIATPGGGITRYYVFP